jgi:hypothetical protein
MGTNLSARECFNTLALRVRQHAYVAVPSTRLHRVRVAHAYVRDVIRRNERRVDSNM